MGFIIFIFNSAGGAGDEPASRWNCCHPPLSLMAAVPSHVVAVAKMCTATATPENQILNMNIFFGFLATLGDGVLAD